MRRALVCALGLFLPAAATPAMDLEFGADSLPYLADHSELVARVEGVERGSARAQSVSVYAARVREVLRGDAAPGAPVAIVVPRGFDVKDPAALASGVVFLRRVAPAEAAPLGLGGSAPAFWLVSGNYGALGPATHAGVSTGVVLEYVTLQSDSLKLAWAERQLQGGDAFLQRSALFELAEPEHRQNPEAVRLLGEAAQRVAIPVENRGTAVQLLETSRSPAATRVLHDMAIDAATPQSLRLDAVRALPSVPGGAEVLRELSTQGAPEVKGLALEVLRELSPARVPAPDLGEIQRLLGSKRYADREQAIRRLALSQPSDETFGLLGGVFQEQAGAGPKERLQAVEALGQMRDPRAIQLLSRVARDAQQPELVRNQAILEIAGQPAGLSLDALESLATTLEPGALKDLATGLAAQ